MTRAALRAQESQDAISIHEEPQPQEHGSPDAFGDARLALKDITDSNTATGSSVATPLKSTKINKDTPASTPAAAARPAPNGDDIETRSATCPTSEGPVETSDAALEEARAVLAATTETNAPATPHVSDLVTESAPNPATSQSSQKVGDACAFDNAALKTPRFNPETHEHASSSIMGDREDSFLKSIKSRTPGRLDASPPAQEEDSFVEKITSRTPRPASRIEDPVEAMDALEDAIEQFSGELPVLESLQIESPVKEHHDTPGKPLAPSVRKTALTGSVKKTVSRTPSKSPSKSPIKSATSNSNNAVKRAPPRTSSGRVSTVKPALKAPVIKKSETRPQSLAPGKSTMSFSNSPFKAANVARKRVTSGPLSTSKAGFVPVKSTKPPTKSSFTLPGEIYAAKLKAQREQSKQEAPAAAKPFKARPAPVSRSSLMPRDNKASQARMSSIGGLVNKKTTTAAQKSMADGNKRIPGLDVPKARSLASRTSMTSSREPPKFAANVPRVASLTKYAPKEEVVQDKPHKRVSGKEVYGRSKLEQKKQEEREEAAKKARAEAAERGRQASREWAEKQKARQQAAQKAAA